MTEKTLTRNEFYKLAHECRDYALRLANHDQDAVEWALCREFNEFRARVQAYDRLAKPLASLRPARPITRSMVLAVTLLIWLGLTLAASRSQSQWGLLLIMSSSMMLILLVFLIPPRAYGTSVEAIEGQVLLVVQALQDLLEQGEMDFSEAAYFQARDVLRKAADELRQQVYLAQTARR